jgi:hypothetical protein
MTLEDLDNHIAALCKEHNVTRIVKPGRGRARVKIRVIRHPPLTEEMAYLVALHEVGHVVLGIPPQSSRLEREAMCWVWALEHSKIAASYPSYQRIAACLVRYLWRATERGWRVPPAGSDFWRLMRWWEPAY